MGNNRALFTSALVLALVGMGYGWSSPVRAPRNPVRFVSPADSSETINQQIAGLSAGDTLVFHNGTYKLGNKLIIEGIQGTAKDPITLRAETPGGAVLDASGDFDFNMIEISNCRHIVIDGLELKGADDGISFREANDHITLQNLNIHHVGNVGIGAQARNVLLGYLTVQHSEIHHTGIGGGTGEGLYLGHHGRLEGFVHHAVIERNYIHHTNEGSQGDGIEIKHGGYANLVRDNVLHDVGPGITVYVTGREDPADVNVIQRNAIWNSDDFGIWSAGDSLIENNIIFDVKDAIGIFVSQNVDLPQYPVRNLTIRNNTVLDVCCGSSPALYIRSAQNNVVVANNAFYQPSLSRLAIRLDVPLSRMAIWKKNYYYGRLSGLSAGPETVLGTRPTKEFTNPTPVAGVIDLYPLRSSRLRSTADPSSLPPDDFNRHRRREEGKGDVGAYEYVGPRNPGWKVEGGFKP